MGKKQNLEIIRGVFKLQFIEQVALSRTTHWIFWLSYLLVFSLNTAIFPAPSDDHFALPLLLGRALLYQGIRLIPVLLLSYFFIQKILPDFIHTRRYRQAFLFGLPLLLIAVLIARLLLGYAIFPLLYGELPSFSLFSARRLFYATLELCTSAMIFIAFYVIVDQLQTAREKEALKNAQLAMELKFLQSQVHPHFLFNTLNNLYGMARKNSEHTASSIAKLAEIFRFSLEKAGQKSIRLEEELDLIQDYLELEKLRYDQRLQIDYQENLDDHRQNIGPLLLLPLVENAFKHGASEATDTIRVEIEVSLQMRQLHFEVRNTIASGQEPGPAGIGLSNLHRQLELQYPYQHSLSYGKEGDKFVVKLQIDFT